MQQRLSLVTLGVRDLARARAFYLDGLGWRPSGAGNESVVFIQLNGLALGLWSRASLAEDAGLDDAEGGFSGISLAYNARSREEVDQVLAEAGAAGGTVVRPAHETFWGGYSGYFADPDGHLWEVAWNPFWEVTEDGRLVLPE
jgi:catechol 2,3-dioxygenase-like lactoylglutathione lyase family enzyme